MTSSLIDAVLEKSGIGPAKVRAIQRAYGRQTEAVLRTDPYQIAWHLRGIGFRTADKIAAQFGFSGQHPVRLAAALRHALVAAEEHGHSCLPIPLWFKQAQSLIDLTVPEYMWTKAAETLTQGDNGPADFIHDDDHIFRRTLFDAETEVAQNLHRRLAHFTPTHPNSNPLSVAIHQWEHQSGVTLAEHQSEAVHRAFSTPVLLVTGGPGTGKTTLIAALVAVAERLRQTVTLVAPTGRAACRMAQATRHPAQTIHRWLLNPSQPDVIVIDEFSMVDLPLLAQLLRAAPLDTRLICIGDPHQLPSVGPGQCCHDLLTTNCLPTVRLTTVFRQQDPNTITRIAHNVLNGTMPPYGTLGDPFCFIPVQHAHHVPKKLLKLVLEEIPSAYPAFSEDVQVLAPMRSGSCGITELNQLFRSHFIPNHAPRLTCGSRCFQLGDRLILTKNMPHLDLANGDWLDVAHLDPHHKTVTLTNYTRTVTLHADDLNALDYAYAITVHKAQGSEFSIVAIPVVTQHFLFLQRHLLYTAITRAKQAVILVGQPRAFKIALANHTGHLRHSTLAKRVRSLWS